MAANRTLPNNPTQAVHRRIITWVFPVIVLAFLAIGLIGYFTIRANALDNLTKAHALVLSDVTFGLDNELERMVEEVGVLAEDETIRRFVQETGSSRSALFLRNTVLGLMVAQIEAMPDTLLRLRYVTADGQIRIEALNTPRGVQIVTDTTTTLPAALMSEALSGQPGDAFLTSPYTVREASGLEFMEQAVFSATFPVFADAAVAEPLGVIQAEIPANVLLEAVTTAADSQLLGEEGRQLVLLNNEGQPLADSSLPELEILYGERNRLSTLAAGRSLLDLITFLQDNPGDLQVAAAPGRIISSGQFETAINAEGMPWRVVIADDTGLIFRDSNSVSIFVLVMSLVVGVAVAVGMSVLLRRVLQPLERATALAQQYSGGELAYDAGDDVLSQAIIQMSDRAQNMIQEMQTQRERIKGNLDIVARVSRETTGYHDLPNLINRVLDLICHQDEFHHAQVFLADEVGYSTSLVYTRDVTIREMLDRGLRPPIDPDAMIREVVQSGRYRVENAASPNANNSRSPVLSGTQARLVLPLLEGDRAIGALDVQSGTAGLFQEEDIQAFELLADQISKAIYSERLIQQSNERVQQIDTLNQELTRSVWQDVDRKFNIERAYHYDLRTVRTGDVPEEPEGARSVPIRIRGEVIGELAVAAPEGLTPDEEIMLQAVTDRVSMAIERARLFQETQISLSETELLYNITRQINEAAALEAVFQAVTEHLVSAARNNSRILILLARPDPVPDAPRLEYAYVWARDEALAVTTGTQVETPSVPYVSLAQAGVELVEDVGRDLDSQPEMAAWFNSQGIHSLMIAPLESRQGWFGVLVCESVESRAFDEQHSRFVQAIADQVAIAVENRSLVQATENERELLSSILDRMPSGVLVLDAETFRPLQINDQIEGLLGRSINPEMPFDTEYYNLHRTGTQLHYLNEELPIFRAASTGDLAFADDIVAVHDNGTQIDLLLNAAPIREADGSISMIVAAFENISSLRGLENALQDNLRETISLYEATRSLSEANEVDDVLDVMIAHLMMIEAHDAAILLTNEQTGERLPVRTIASAPETFELPAALFDNRQPVWVSDVMKAEMLTGAERQTLLENSIAAVGTLPLRARSQQTPIAWITVIYDEPYDVEANAGRYLTTLADSAATALDSRFLFNATEAALQEASILYQASRSLADANNTDDILNAVIAHLLNEDVDSVFLTLLATEAWDSPGAAAEVVASWTKDETAVDLLGVTLGPDQFPAWNLLASPELVIVEDLQQAGHLDELEQMGIESLGAQSVVIMPLRTANRVLGAIWMGASVPHAYNERDVRIFQSFAEQTSLSMDAARLYEQAERRAGQLQTSSQVSQFASSILDLDMLLPRLVDLIQTAFHYDHVQIFLMDREDRYAVLRASTGEAGRQLLGIKHRLEKGSNSVIGAVTATNQPVVALDTGTVDVVHRPNPYLPHTRSEMALPLTIKGKVVGALDVQSNLPNAFSDEDVSVLTTLAAQISVAIDNARLFEQAEHRASDMSLLFAVTTAAASAETLTEALENVTNDLRDSLKALSVSIYLPVIYLDEVTGNSMMTMRAEAIAGYKGVLSDIQEIRVGDPENIIGLAASSFRSSIINQIEEEPLYHPVMPEAQSAVIVPLTSASQIIGLITMENANPFAYNHETLTLLQTMGGTLTALIQNQQLLERVQETNDQLLEMDRIKSEFLANMSHELRTPLNSIIGFSRVILKGIDGPLTEMQEQDLTTIYNSGQHLLNLINDILDQAKIAAGKMDIKPEYFDIKAVVEGVRSIGIGLVKDKPIDIRVEIESGLPQVYGDEFRTRQVLLNLLSNASKFTQSGSISFNVYRAQHSTTGANMVRVDVVDTGIGIAEKDLPLLFEAFRQIDSSLTRTAGGTGLGLPISKALIEIQGGEMLVSSKVNAGSTFSITIPVDAPGAAEDREKATDEAEAITDEAPATTNGHRATDTAPAHSNGSSAQPDEDVRRTTTMPSVMPAKRQVLVIEDNPDRVDQFRRAIQREGFDVFAASIPLEAEAMASGLRPSVIIMDVNFANGTGWDILQKIKERDDTFDIPVVVVTLSDERERALEAGAFAFMQHPIIPEELANVVLSAEQESLTDRILIIDDQPESTRLLRQLLDEHGHFRVFEAHNGSEGVSMVARRRPDLVILDLRMPEMDGFAVLEELRANAETANIPVLVVTSDTLEPDEQNQLANVDVLYKTSISLDDSQQFIEDVQIYLKRIGD